MKLSNQIGCFVINRNMLTMFSGRTSTMDSKPCLTQINPYSMSTTTPILIKKSNPNNTSQLLISRTIKTILQVASPIQIRIFSIMSMACVTQHQKLLYDSNPTTRCIVPISLTTLTAKIVMEAKTFNNMIIDF